MKIELRNIKHSESQSQETFAYNATVYIDGKRFAKVENDGRGGADYVYPACRGDRAEWEAKLAEISKHCATLPPSKVHGLSLDWSFEAVCHDKVAEYLELQDLKALLKRSLIVVQRDGRIQGINLRGRSVTEIKRLLLERHPGVTFMNDLPIDEALKIYRKALA